MTLPAHLTTQVRLTQQQFLLQWTEAELAEPTMALDILKQFEQALLALAKKAEPTDEVTQYLQAQLNWLAQQVERVTAEKNLVAEQLLQITRARKGNASYDDHKPG